MKLLHSTFRNSANKLFLLILAISSLTVKASAQDDAELLMQLVPDQVKSGTQFTALMQFRNLGTSTWSGAKGYHLAARGKSQWGITKVALPAGKRIAPGETVTFKFTATAPAGSGSHTFHWQMRRGSSWIGKPSDKVDINVADYKSIPDDADFVYQNIPTEMFTDQVYTVVLHFKNIGHTAWMPGLYQLKPVATGDTLAWAIDQVELKEIVRPDEFYTFRFNIIAPSVPGNYPFQWQIHHDSGGAFGDSSSQLTIKVMESM